MPESKVIRLCAVFGAFGLAVFSVAGMAAAPSTRHVVLPFVVGGLTLALLSGLIAGIAWALTSTQQNPSGGA